MDEAAIVGQIAHIVAHSAAGPRGDQRFPPEELDREPNLLLLCAHHHALVDSQESTYTVEELRRWKDAQVLGQLQGVARSAAMPFLVPYQVPGAPDPFVDREAELRQLDDVTFGRRAAGGSAVVVLTGTRGIGKTAICRRWAHQNRSRFRDGQLHADFGELRHRGGVAVGDVLGGFLAALGFPRDAIPPDLAARSGLFRSAVADKEVLILVDGAAHAAEVRPLIPNSERCVVMLAGGSALLELTGDRGRLVELKRLDIGTATDLLTQLIGDARAAIDPEGVAELVRCCDGLPVALRICGSRLQPDRPVSWLVEQLADEAARLERLAWAPGRSLDVVFNGAYRALKSRERLLYRRLGIVPGPSYTVGVAAAANGCTEAQATELLGGLVRAQLLDELSGRYRFHDLLRLHARGRAERDESEETREAAVRRVIDFYVQATHVIDLAITPRRMRLAQPPQQTAEGLPSPGSRDGAFEWFEAERQNLLAVMRAAAHREWDEEVWRICESLWACYFNRKPYAEWLEAHELAVRSAYRCQNEAAEARMRIQLAKALIETGAHERAERELVTARRLATRTDHPQLHASVLEFMGHLDLDRGQYQAARLAFDEARATCDALGNSRGVSLQTYHVGRALAGGGEYREAISTYREALELIDPADDELLLGRTLLHIGEAQASVGDRTDAAASLRRALDISRRLGLAYYEARALQTLALLAVDTDDVSAALAYRQQAHEIYAALGSRPP